MALLQRNGSDFQQRTFMSGEAVDLQCRLLMLWTASITRPEPW
jgi:hypothetical protein